MKNADVVLIVSMRRPRLNVPFLLVFEVGANSPRQNQRLYISNSQSKRNKRCLQKYRHLEPKKQQLQRKPQSRRDTLGFAPLHIIISDCLWTFRLWGVSDAIYTKLAITHTSDNLLYNLLAQIECRESRMTSDSCCSSDMSISKVNCPQLGMGVVRLTWKKRNMLGQRSSRFLTI